MPANEVAVQTSNVAKPLVAQAVKELQEALGGSKVAKSAGQPTFRLSLELDGTETAQLKDSPNADQAYIIKPAERGEGLRIITLGTRGLYYEAKTIQQITGANVPWSQAVTPTCTP